MGNDIAIIVHTAEQARDPEVIQWCLAQRAKGLTLQQIRHMVGLGEVSNDDWRWRVLRREIQAAERPDDEGQALLDYYTDIDDQIHELQRQIKWTRAKIAMGERHRVVETSKGPIIVEDKTYHNYPKLLSELTKQVTELKEKRYTGLLKKKELSSQKGKYAGAKITIIHNVPRPDDDGEDG